MFHKYYETILSQCYSLHCGWSIPINCTWGSTEKQTVPEYSSGCIFVKCCGRIYVRAPWLLGEWGLDLWPKDSSLQKRYPPSGNIQPAPGAAGRDETPPAGKPVTWFTTINPKNYALN